VEKRRLGASLKVSATGLGCMGRSKAAAVVRRPHAVHGGGTAAGARYDAPQMAALNR
jgi:hypothetical protein